MLIITLHLQGVARRSGIEMEQIDEKRNSHLLYKKDFKKSDLQSCIIQMTNYQCSNQS